MGKALKEINIEQTETGRVGVTARRVALVALGWVLVLAGIVGLPLPVVPGLVLLLAGVAVLRSQSAWFARGLDEWRVRFPRRNHFLGWVGMGRSRFRCHPDNSASRFQSLNNYMEGATQNVVCGDKDE